MADNMEEDTSDGGEITENDGDLDPRVQMELETLNRASTEINQLELELDDARATFRLCLSESTQRLNNLSKKLGSCIEKARPYYEARISAKEAHFETQKAALRFDRACSMQNAAKEMVNLAEQGFMSKGPPFDPAWQEMLNHATIKVNEAEIERIKSEEEHQIKAQVFNDCEQRVKRLQKELKRSIAKSRPYFEEKANINTLLEKQKHNVIGRLEKQITDTKSTYSMALHSLEEISDQIHQQRKEQKARRELGQRSSGVGAEAPSPPPELAERLSGGSHTEQDTKIKSQDDTTKDSVQCDQTFKVPTAKNIPPNKMLGEFKSLPNTQTTQPKYLVTDNKVPLPNTLSPNGSAEDQEFSDSESVCSSQAVMDDEQIGKLMIASSELELPDDQPPMSPEDKLRRNMTLPAKLRHLETYLKDCQIEDIAEESLDTKDSSCQTSPDGAVPSLGVTTSPRGSKEI